MARLLRKRVDAEPGVGAAVGCCWHSAEPLLAVRHTAAVVVHSLFPSSAAAEETSQKQQESSTLACIQSKDNSEVTALAWHPLLRMVVVAWGDGGLTTWVDGESPFEESSVHAGTQATAVAWHPSGKRLAVGDAEGAVSVWACDRNARLSFVCKFAPGASARAAVADFAFRTAGGALQASPFYVVCADGVVFVGDDTGGSLVEAVAVGAPVAALWYCADRDSLVAATTAGTAAHFRQSTTPGKLELATTVKLGIGGNGSLPLADTLASGGGGGDLVADDAEEVGFLAEAEKARRNVAWCTLGVVASLARERFVRMWDLGQGRSFILSPPSEHQQGDVTPTPSSIGGDPLVCLDFNKKTHALAAATASGSIFLWKHAMDPDQQLQDAWVPGDSPISVDNGGAALSFMAFGPGDNLLAVVADGRVEVLAESEVACTMRDGTAAFLISPSLVRVERVAASDGSAAAQSTTIMPEIGVRWLLVGKNSVVLWNGQQIATYTLPERQQQQQQQQLTATLDAVGSSHATTLAIHRDHTLALVSDGRVQLCNTGAVAKQTLSLPPAEGDPVLVDVAGDFLAVVTSNNVLRLFDLQKREARPYGVSKVLDASSAVGTVTSISISPDGTRVCLLSPATSDAVHVYMVETGRVVSHQFSTDCTPVRACWDASYPKLLAVEVRKGLNTGGSNGPARVAVLFSPPESDLNVMEQPVLLPYETIEAPRNTEGLLGIEAPRVFFATRGDDTKSADEAASSSSSSPSSLITTVRLRDFATMADATPSTAAATLATRDAMLAFSYCVALGDMDGAYSAIRAVQSPAVWAGMAKMIIQARRGDLLPALAVCLGNIGNARAAAALRTSAHEEPAEARLAIVAMHLGMTNEAEELLKSSGRWDLLNRLAQNSGRWEVAVALAEEHDRVHLRATHFACGRYYEAVSDTKRAAEEYERAETHAAEVPRMLSEFGQLSELDRYIGDRTGNKKLLQWRARFAESRGDVDGALAKFEQAADWHSVVRLLCIKGETEEAAAIVERTGDRAAAYHLARQLEGVGTDEAARQALKLLGRAGALGHALRVAMEQGLDGEVAALALQGSRAQQLTAARYLETRSLFDKAASLYHRAGSTARAVTLCINGGLDEELARIAKTLDGKADPELVVRCAAWLMERGQHSDAVPLYIAAGQQAKALDICAAYSVPITDELAARMAPGEGTEDPARRTRILRMIAKACDRQGNYALASKTYTQARDTGKAMKSLIKTGDIEKVVFFAQVSQSAETYTMAANYLQTREWRTSPELMRHIIAFYKKARNMDSLARFYESCAHVEVDEYRNYEKALGAMREALLHAHRSKTAEGPRLVSALEEKAKLVQQFLQARKLFQAGQESEAIVVCQELVNRTAELGALGAGSAGSEQLVQLGTVYSLLVEYFASKGDMQQAHALCEQMHSRKIGVLQNIPEEVVQAVYSALKQPIDHLLSEAGGGGSGDVDEEGDEDGARQRHRHRSAASAMAPAAVDDVQEELEVADDAEMGGNSSDVEEDIQQQPDEDEVR